MRLLDCGTVAILDAIGHRLDEDRRTAITVVGTGLVPQVLRLAGYDPRHRLEPTVPQALASLEGVTDALRTA